MTRIKSLKYLFLGIITIPFLQGIEMVVPHDAQEDAIQVQILMDNNMSIPVKYETALKIPLIKKQLEDPLIAKPHNQLTLNAESILRNVSVNHYDCTVLCDFLDLVASIKDPAVFKHNLEYLSSGLLRNIAYKIQEDKLSSMSIEKILKMYSLSLFLEFPRFSLFNEVFEKKIAELALKLSQEEKNRLQKELEIHSRASSLLSKPDNRDAIVMIIPEEGKSQIVNVYYEQVRLSKFLRQQIEKFDSTSDIIIDTMGQFNAETIKFVFALLQKALGRGNDSNSSDYSVQIAKIISAQGLETWVQALKCFNFLNIEIPKDYYGFAERNRYTEQSTYSAWSNVKKKELQKLLSYIYKKLHSKIIKRIVYQDPIEEMRDHVDYIKKNFTEDMLLYYKTFFSMTDPEAIRYTNFISSLLNSNKIIPFELIAQYRNVKPSVPVVPLSTALPNTPWKSYVQISLYSWYDQFNKQLADFRVNVMLGASSIVGIAALYKVLSGRK